MPLKVNLLATRMQSLDEEAERKCEQQQCEDAIGLLEEAVRIQSVTCSSTTSLASAIVADAGGTR
jgi:hypothetical protein